MENGIPTTVLAPDGSEQEARVEPAPRSRRDVLRERATREYRESSLAMARAHDLDAQVYELEGDHLAAEWNRALAACYREPGPANEQHKDRVYVRLLARTALLRGSMIGVPDEYVAEVEAEVERQGGFQ